ncbi:hypothetical protein CEK62_06555 [Alcanivorax sp. N3-2A]|nr:hypothetical protein CEK62_06555 [Alcanivorax sp. N3-2A]|tara:strand:- start:22361 stop:23656 length:1296 start_codon:yes stop_codon:yes gene_type:complete
MAEHAESSPPNAENGPPGLENGRFEIDQLQEQAERLLDNARAGDSELRMRLAGVGGGGTPGVREARNLVARDFGFRNWTRFEQHVRELDQVRLQHNGRHIDEGVETMHIRCGSDLQSTLPRTGLNGRYHAFTDPFCIGPVQEQSTECQIEERARFLASAFGLDSTETLDRQRGEYQGLDDASRCQRVVLWFEHDSYDQLILSYLLHRIGEWPRTCQVEIIAVDSIPGVKRFVGLGQLAPDVLGWLWQRRRQVDQDALALGRKAWRAISADTPKRLDRLSQRLTPSMPMMGRALRRHLLELPDEDTGLGLSEQLAVQLVAERGPIRAGDVFSALVREREPLPYLGDTMFWWLLQPLMQGDNPPLQRQGDTGQPWQDQLLTITSHGHEILSGHRNWLNSRPPRRWVGGVTVDGSADSWCLNKATGRPMPRAAA